MPSRNIVKTYVENGYYHIYNRGVEKRTIFLDEQDCITFFHYLKMYLSPVEELKQQQLLGIRIRRFIPLNLSQEVDLLAFALMPNHIHLQVKQITSDGIIKLMRRLTTGYVMYFNNKYKRVGALFQSAYKAVLLERETHFLHLSRYIHLNASKLPTTPANFLNFSSYPYYLGHKQASWIKPQEVLSYFKRAQRNNATDILSYQSFVEDYRQESHKVLGTSALDIEDC